MPSKKQYNLVHNDEYDTRIPLHSEEAFHRGIVFHAKFIGSMEVPRPTSRMEIVAAMRRIRYEFKAKGIKKKKVTLEVSVDGLKVTLRKKKAFIDAHGQYFDPLLKRVNLQFPILQKKQQYVDENKLVLMHHPIYRIFYVSHDSHDLKIFSYIARDGSGNSFRCNVFKSSKKSQAMRVVRTVGQAFEVCHKLSLNNPAGGGDRTTSTTSDDQQQTRVAGDGENHRRDGLDEYDDRDELGSIQPQPSPSSVHKDISLLGDAEDSILDQPCPLRTQPAEVTTTTTTTTTCPASPVRQSPLGNIISDQLMNGELTTLKHEIQLLRERLDQQSQQTRAAVAHARLLQDQLAAETAARVEAQARTHQLLVQNKELLEHIAALVSHLREHERISGVPMSGQPSSQVVTSSGTLSQNSPAADISALGQYNSTWDPHGPLYSRYSPLTSPCYPGILSNGPYGFARPICDNYAEELRYQAQLWENLRVGNPYATSIPLSPYSPTTTTTTTTTIPHCYGPGCSLPPSGRSLTQRSAQTPSSPISTLPRASRVPRSPTRYQQRATSAPRSRSLERPVQHNTGTVDNNDVDFATREAFFIKPLPCNCQRNCDSRSTIRGCNKSTPPTPLKSNLHDLMRPLVLDSPPSVRKNCYSEHLSRGVQTEPSFYQQNNCPLILLTESKSVKSSGDSMPKIDESEDLESDEEQENNERSVQMPKPIRRNSQ